MPIVRSGQLLLADTQIGTRAGRRRCVPWRGRVHNHRAQIVPPDRATDAGTFWIVIRPTSSDDHPLRAPSPAPVATLLSSWSYRPLWSARIYSSHRKCGGSSRLARAVQ
jgi:hypothetical protein